VLNDGRTPNTLTVRITNVSGSGMPLNGRTSAAPSTVVLSFDAGKSWGLATPDALAACTLDAIDGVQLEEADWAVAPGRQLGEGLAWTLTHQKDAAVLAPGQVIQLRVSNIVSALAGGDTNLYLRYENIPGYWDGQFVCTIEKEPIHYDDRGHVGVGTATPARPLQVGDDVGGLGLESSGGDAYLRFGDHTGRKLRVARSPETAGGAINTYTTGALLTVQDTGEVGVGTDQPRFSCRKFSSTVWVTVASSRRAAPASASAVAGACSTAARVFSRVFGPASLVPSASMAAAAPASMRERRACSSRAVLTAEWTQPMRYPWAEGSGDRKVNQTPCRTPRRSPGRRMASVHCGLPVPC
jgi:hypothetical protein